MQEVRFENKKAQEMFDARMAEIDDFYSEELAKIEEMIEPDVMSVAGRLYMANQHRADLINSAIKMAHDWELRERMFLHTISRMSEVVGGGLVH